LTALLPVQSPSAVHDVAWVDDQTKVESPPLFTVLGLACKLIVGASDATETVTDCTVLPPVPLQVSA
jgi:hypothetical protein